MGWMFCPARTFVHVPVGGAWYIRGCVHGEAHDARSVLDEIAVDSLPHGALDCSKARVSYHAGEAAVEGSASPRGRQAGRGS